MTKNSHLIADLRFRLERILAEGLADEPESHARQVAAIAGVLHAAFSAQGFTVTLVGGSAIEIHAPGIYMSGDLDLVIEKRWDARGESGHIFESLGLERLGRHWRKGSLFIETVPGPVAGPVEDVEVKGAVFRVVKKEVPLRDRVVGFKHWRHTAYGDQAIAMLVAFGEELDMDWLEKELRREGSMDALRALRTLATADILVTHERLLALLNDLHQRRTES